MKKQKNQALKILLVNLSNDTILWRGYLGSGNDWASFLYPRKTGFNFDGSFSK